MSWRPSAWAGTELAQLCLQWQHTPRGHTALERACSSSLSPQPPLGNPARGGQQGNNQASLEKELILQSPGSKAALWVSPASSGWVLKRLGAGCLQEKHGQNEGTHVPWQPRLPCQDRGQAQRGCLQVFSCSSQFRGGYVCRGVDAGALRVPPEWCGRTQSWSMDQDLDHAFNCIKIKTRSSLNSEFPQATKVM